MDIFQCRICLVFFSTDKPPTRFCPDCQDDQAKEETVRLNASNLEESGGVGEASI